MRKYIVKIHEAATQTLAVVREVFTDGGHVVDEQETVSGHIHFLVECKDDTEFFELCVTVGETLAKNKSTV